MLFHSPVFIAFLLIFLAGLAVFKGERRIVYTALASAIFYAWWYPPYLILLIALIVFTHFFAVRRVASNIGFAVVIALTLSPMLVFKYTGFISENVSWLFGLGRGYAPDWSLPLGISFITFTAIAYMVDTRKGLINPDKNFWHTALFISFFPQLIAGPILRAHELMPQLAKIRLALPNLKPAFFLFAIGALKKVAVADQIAPVVDRAYSGEGVIPFGQALIAFYGFSVQIYCDFSGYTDMALALGLLLHVNFPLNFDRPYMALSLRNFWRHWHMTLSRWLRDYLYIPLGGSRNGLAMAAMAVMVTMLLGGLWHGAAWTFVVWGGLHGLLIVIENQFVARKISFDWCPRWAKWLFIFHFVTFAWIFFRAPDFGRAMDMISALANPDLSSLSGLAIYPPIAAILLLGFHPLDNFQKITNFASRLPAPVILPFSAMLILICAALSVDNPSAFIYFDF